MGTALLRLGLNSSVPWREQANSISYYPISFIVDSLRTMSTPNMIPSERQLARNKACELVDGIRKEHGFLKKSTFARMDSEMQREVEEAMLKKDDLIGSSTITHGDPIVAMWNSCEGNILIQLQIGKKPIQ